MPKYITPQIARQVGTGLPLAQYSDADLAGMIALAEAQIDAFMEWPETNGLGFATGARTDRTPWNPINRRTYPLCFPVPVKSVTSFQIVVSQSTVDGSPIVATVPPNLVLIQNDSGYLEPISLSVIAYGLTPVIAQLSLIQPFALVTYTAGYQIAKLAYPLYSADDVTYHSFLPAWDTAAQTPVVYKNGVAQGSGYTVSALNGSVAFSSPLLPSDLVTADFTHQIPDVVAQAARMAFVDAAHEYIANQSGLAGMDMMRLGEATARRMGTFRQPPDPKWHALVQQLKPLHLGISA